MNAQNGKTPVNFNEQFDKHVLADQIRKPVKVSGIPPDAVVYYGSNTFPPYNSKMDLGDGILTKFLESPMYSDEVKIQFIKDAIADTVRDAVNCFNYAPCNFWRSSKEATALMNAYFDEKQVERSEQQDIKYRRLKFVTQGQYPESYQMITDYFKNRPTQPVKYHYEVDLVYWLVQMGKEEEALTYLQLLVDDFINGKLPSLRVGSRFELYANGNVFDLLCLSENESIAKRATDLLFRLLIEKEYETMDLDKLAFYLDKERHAKLLSTRKSSKWPVSIMPDEKVKSLVADLNSIALKNNLSAIKLTKLRKFLISISHPYTVIHDYLFANNFIVGFYWEDADSPVDYVKLFEEHFSRVAREQNCNHFTIGQITKTIGKNVYDYTLFVKYNNSNYKLGYKEKGSEEYNDIQRLVKMLNLCLIDNKDKKRFVGMYSDAFAEFILIEPAIIMPLNKKYNLGLYVIDLNDGAPKN